MRILTWPSYQYRRRNNLQKLIFLDSTPRLLFLLDETKDWEEVQPLEYIIHIQLGKNTHTSGDWYAVNDPLIDAARLEQQFRLPCVRVWNTCTPRCNSKIPENSRGYFSLVAHGRPRPSLKSNLFSPSQVRTTYNVCTVQQRSNHSHINIESSSYEDNKNRDARADGEGGRDNEKTTRVPAGRYGGKNVPVQNLFRLVYISAIASRCAVCIQPRISRPES